MKRVFPNNNSADVNKSLISQHKILMTAMSYTEVTLPPSDFESELTLSPIISAPPSTFHVAQKGSGGVKLMRVCL